MFGSDYSPAVIGAPDSVRGAHRRARISWWSTYGFCIGGTLLVALIAVRTAPSQFSLAFILFVIIVALAIVKPVLAVYPIVFFSVLGDAVTVPWYPFTKDLSSQESLLFISNQLKFTPLEVCLGALLVGWLF